MKKVLWLIGFLLLIQVINAELIPLTVYSDKEYLGENTWKFNSYSIPQYYFNDLNELNKIDGNFQDSNSEWNYTVTKGLYSLGVKLDGTIGFKYKNKGLTLKLIGIGFYNSDTKEFIKKTGLNLTNPTKNGNSIKWNLPYDANYYVKYENKKFKDVLEIPQQIKDYLWNNKPEGWNTNNTWFGLIFDVNGYNLNLSDFDSNQRINFLDENTIIFNLPESKVYHENHYSGEGYVDNTGLEWIKHRVFFDGHYIEAIPFSALESPTGFLRWNATINVDVIQSTDDAQNTLFGIDLTNNDLSFTAFAGYPAGVIFQDISIEQATTINEALLNVHFVPTCQGIGNCSIDWWGVDADDITTWSSTHKPTDETKTTATVNHFSNSDFTSNAFYASTDLNVTAIIQEILDRANWIQDNNVGFIANKGSFGIGENLKYKTYDYSSTSWTLTIDYEGAAPNPCQPTKNELWHINEPLYCYNEDINLGTGNPFININGFLGLFASMLKGKTPFIFSAKPYWGQQNTFDSNISVSSGANKEYIAHNETPDGYDYHLGSTSIWISTQEANDHWVEINLGEIRKCLNVLFTVYYTFNWFTDVNAEYYDGTTWNLLYDNTNFQTTDCNELWDNGADYICDLNLSINDSCSKVRYQVEYDSKEAGARFDLDSILGMNNIVIYDKTPARTVFTVFDSNFQIRVEGA